MAPSLRRRVVRRTTSSLPPAEIRHGLRASAQRFSLKNRKLTHAQSVGRREWQEDAWSVFDDVPEIKYWVWYAGNVMAKCRFYVGVIPDDDPDGTPIPVTDPGVNLPPGVAQRAHDELDRLKAPLGGRAEIARAMNMNLEVTAEAYLIGFGPREVGQTDPETGEPETVIIPEQWGIYSVSQVSEKDGVYQIRERPALTGQSTGEALRQLDPNLDFIIRIFQRHPRWTLESDCNMRGILSDCEALTLLANSIKAEAKSRMSAGYLLVPSELTTGPDTETEPEEGEESQIDQTLQDLYDGVVEPVEDPSAASSVAPTFLRGPADSLKEFRYVAVSRPADASVLEKMKMCIDRIARGANLPVEVIMGHQETTFANALQVKQDTFDDHFQPRCVLISDALTIGFLRPNLEAQGLDPAVTERLVVWFDPSAMIKQVNPVDSADQGITLDLISGEAWRRAWGWSEDDAPDAVERLVRAVLHLSRFDPGISTAAMELLGVKLHIPETLPGIRTGAPETTPGEAPPPEGKEEQQAQASVERLLAQAIRAKYDVAGQGAARTLEQLLADILARDSTLAVPMRAAGALPTPAAADRNFGYDLMQLDRDLRAKLLVAADKALTRALERAGNKLRSKAGQARALARAGVVNSIYVAATLGPAIIASAGFTDDDLIGGDAWATLEHDFFTWAAGTQKAALSIVAKHVTLTPAHRHVIEQQQTADLASAWLWFRDELQALAQIRLYDPDVPVPERGEHDPSVRVPVGLVRQALARAGGATGLTDVSPTKGILKAAPGGNAAGTNIYVAVNNGLPVGGIGTGELLGNTLKDGSLGVDAYQWVYGPAYRANPFEDHEVLDGEVFTDFDSDVLVAGDWIGDYYFPGDHQGCNCDIAPVIVEVGALEDSAAAAGLTELE